MRMALDAFRSASDDHFVRGRQSSCAIPRAWLQAARQNPLDLSALSAPQKQDHSFATHTIQRTLVKLFGLHASCILVSESERRCTTSFTEFASVAPVRIEIENSSLLKFLNTLSNSLQHPMPFSPSDARLRRDFLTTQIHSSGLSTAASQRLSSCNLVIKPKDMRIVTFLTEVSHCSVLAAAHFQALTRAGSTRAYSQRLS